MKKLLKLPTLVVLALLVMQCSNDDDSTTQQAEPEAETVTDADGNVYNTVKMGNQTWMVENLKTTKYNDGTDITLATFDDDWYNGSTQLAYYQWADTSDLGNNFEDELPSDYYGAMYNHFAIETGKLAPTGWRIPTEQDFIELESFISNNGHAGQEGAALKATSGWSTASGNGTDSFGFNALPNGYVAAQGTSTAAPVISTWTTTNLSVSTLDQTRTIISLFDESTIGFEQNSIRLGAGIRCIKE